MEMTGDIEGIAGGLADLGTGAAVAGAIERERGSTTNLADGHTHEGACLNCGTPLLGPHCHACGQRAHVHRTLGAFFHDLLHGVLHFEGKTWRTIPMLAWQPGKLTREYIEGRRARYVSPIALFLFVVFLSFALFSMLGGPDSLKPNIRTEELNTAYVENGRQIAKLEASLDKAKPEERPGIQGKIDKLKEDQRNLGLVLGEVKTDFSRDFSDGFKKNPLPKDSQLAQAIEHVRENPQLMIYKAQTSAYKYSWMLIPLSVPFVWLLFPFSRRFRGYDHTVFVTYSITFMIALAALASLLIYFGAAAAGGLLLLYAPYHMYRHLRGTYGVSRLGGIWRMLALSLFAWIAIGLFAALIGWMAAGH
ncbi:hypothetical protein GCM10011515_02770 [Tsuneonella deserti]|uniref:DUF3667 domain-containing protein n=1 Tax=Tsuneonella deserti TaxID=2035528 RepID=A0ABQ1RXU9_9SPHN|nr:DUF3667 domain-containing protein [Tsuneonella deserti]GGD86701.1 hypothetical protein GCM10011515_02770 [Tsuneonella deserti]